MSLHFKRRCSSGRWLTMSSSSHMKYVAKWNGISLALDALWQYHTYVSSKISTYLTKQQLNVWACNRLWTKKKIRVRDSIHGHSHHDQWDLPATLPYHSWRERHNSMLLTYKIHAYTDFDNLLFNVNWSALIFLRDSFLVWQTSNITVTC